jgi:hypothetical protein
MVKLAGFAAEEGAFSWRFVKEDEGKETVYWSGMTEPGLMALIEVIDCRKVAVQLVTAQAYILGGAFLRDQNWQPILLLPARAANLDGPGGLLRVPQAAISDVLPMPGWKQLTPQRVRFTVERMSI